MNIFSFNPSLFSIHRSKPPHRFLASLNTSAPASHVARLIADKQFTTALEYIRKHDEIASDHHDNGLGIDAQGVLKAKMAYILENLNSSYFEDELIVGEGGEAEDEEAVGGDKPDKSTVQSRRCVVDTADIFSSLDQIEVI